MTTIVIVGPADGLRAYRFPNAIPVSDETVGLSGSELSLAEGGCAFKISRVLSRGAEESIRIGAFKQVYESSLRRAGHSFGVILEFEGTVANLEGVYEILTGLLATIEENCITDGRFCDIGRFTEFLTGKLNPIVRNVLARLEHSEFRPLPYIPTRKFNIEGYYTSVPKVTLDLSVQRCWDWFLYGPGGVLIKALIVSPEGQSAIGSIYQVLPPLESIDYASARILTNELSRMHDEQDKSKLEIVNLTEDRRVFIAKNHALEESEQTLQIAIKGLERRLAENAVKRQSVLTETDFQYIKQVVVEGVRLGAPRPKMPAPVEVFDTSYSDSTVYWIVGAFAFIVLVGLAILAYVKLWS